jgi:hypothetical protein
MSFYDSEGKQHYTYYTAETEDYFCPEDGDIRFLRNVGDDVADFTESHPRRQYFIGTAVTT